MQQEEDEEESTPANAGKKSWIASDKPGILSEMNDHMSRYQVRQVQVEWHGI